MKRLGRRMLNAVMILSLLLCVATAGLWVRSYYAEDVCGLRLGRSALAVATHPGGFQFGVAAVRPTVVRRWLHRNHPWGAARIVGPESERFSLKPPPARQIPIVWQSPVPLWLGFGLLPPTSDRDLSPGDRRFALTATATAVLSPGFRWPGLLLPYWFVLALALLPLALGVLRRMRRKQRLCSGECPGCGYDLTRNVSGVCPECGTTIVKGNA